MNTLCSKTIVLALLWLTTFMPMPFFCITLITLLLVMGILKHPWIDKARNYLGKSQFWIYAFLYIFIARLFTNSYALLTLATFLPLLAEWIMQLISNYQKRTVYNVTLSFLCSGLIAFILKSTFSTMDFPTGLSILSLSLLSGFAYLTLYIQRKLNTIYLHYLWLFLFPVLTVLLKMPLVAAIILSALVTLYFFLNHSFDELKSVLFFTIGVFYYLALGWKGFLILTFVSAFCVYITMMTYEFKIELAPQKIFPFHQPSALLSYQILPALLAIGYYFTSHSGIMFYYILSQSLIVFFVSNQEFEKVYARTYYTLPRLRPSNRFRKHAVTLEGLILSTLSTILFMLIVSLFSHQISILMIVYVLILAIIAVIFEKYLFYKRLLTDLQKYWVIPLLCVIITLLIALISG